MLAKNPNYDWDAIERRAVEIADAIGAKRGKFYADIPKGATANWHIVRTLPGKEEKALQYLADRAIGAFLPTFVRGSIVRGRKGQDLTGTRRLIFPGLVFVFVWDVLEHWRRIHACPGVQSVVIDGSGQPVVVPDAEINRMQAMQYGYQLAKKGRKRYGGRRDDGVEVVRISTWSALDDIAGLDSEGRIGALAKALGVDLAACPP